MKNILITSAGKRVTLVQLFKKELKKYDSEAKVFTTDMKPEMAPACIVSDGSFLVQHVLSEGYFDQLVDICQRNFIGLIVPTIDTELILLSEKKDQLKLKGIDVAVSDEYFVKLCRDKRLTNDLFVQNDIRIPRPVDKNNPIFPMFAKPYDGSLSKDLYFIQSKSELTKDILEHPRLMFMEYIDKKVYKEFTVDIYFGKDNQIKGIVPRERIEIRAGEINKGMTRKNHLIEFLHLRLSKLKGVYGCICIQVFYNESTEDAVAIEINPRFGGGYPLSYYAGANYPDYLIKEYLLNQEISYDDSWKDNTLMLRYDCDVVVYDSKE